MKLINDSSHKFLSTDAQDEINNELGMMNDELGNYKYSSFIIPNSSIKLSVLICGQFFFYNFRRF